MARVKVPPPEIDGYEYVGHIGSGGYSEVFESRDDLGRQVAVKVLTEDTSDAEARAMASVSVHSAIVDVFKTDLTAGGLRYLVMPFFGGPTYSDLLRDGPLDVAEVLSVGVQMAGALEFAHQNGLLHRDVKPANILTNDLGRPGLTDFGIAARHGDDAHQKAVSLPWAPPEVLEDRMPDTRSDVYALAATLFTLLAGHAPFVEPRGDNSDRALTARTVSAAPPAIPRSDVPTSLDSLLRWALAKEPSERPGSAESFGRALQAVESELRLSQTRLEVAERTSRGRRAGDSGPLTGADGSGHSEQTQAIDADATLARSVRVIRSEAPDDRTRKKRPGGGATAAGTGVIGGVPMVPAVRGGGRVRPGGLGAALPDPAPERSYGTARPGRAGTEDASQRRRWMAPVLIAAALVVIGVLIYAVGAGDGTTPRGKEPCEELDGCDGGATTALGPVPVPEVSGIVVTRTDAVVRVEWTKPDDPTVVGFRYQRCDGADPTPVDTSDAFVEVAGVAPGSGFCLDVASRTGDDRLSDVVRATEGA
ncbi:MAG TPA: protein kinase [Microthrixaceae bacterium]|nr:protein kinase [Microthrixaceae bacterium]